MLYFRPTICKLLIVGLLAMLYSIDCHSQSVNELMRKAEKNNLALGAKIEGLVYKKNDWSSKTDAFAPFLVSFSHVENHCPNEKNEYEALHIGFNVNELNQVSQIYFDVRPSFDAFNFLKSRFGMWTSTTSFGNEASAAFKMYNWAMKDCVLSLYIDTVSQKKIIISSPNNLPTE